MVVTTREHKEKTIVGPLIGVILVITIIAAFAVVILRQTAAQAQKEEQTAQAVQQAEQAQLQAQAATRSQPQEDAVVPASSFQFPSDMKAAMVAPGREFLTVLSGNIEQAELALSGEEQQLQQQQTLDLPEIDEQQVRDEIDQMVQDAAELGLDTLFVSLENAYGTLWESPGVMTSFDALGYLYDSAHQAGLSLYGVHDLSFVVGGSGRMSYISAVDAQTLDQCAEQMKNIVSGSQLDGLLLDGYLNPETDYSYAAFTQTGANVSMDTYMTESTTLLVKTAREAAQEANASLPVGLAVSPVWATADEQEGGIDLAYTQTSLGAYHADTKGMIEQGLCDFVVVKNYGATASETLPFEQIADWWNDTLSQSGVAALMGHASSRAGVWENGWGPNYELATQWEIAQGEEAFSGSVFNSLETLLQDPNYTTYYLTEAWTQAEEGAAEEQTSDGESQEDASQPQTMQTASATQAEPAAQADLYTIDAGQAQQVEDGESIGSGSYQDLADSYAGASILEQISPVGNRSVAHGDTIIITAVAQEGARVTAEVNGETIQLAETNRSAGISGYRRYSAEYEVDGTGMTSSDMGNVVVTATLNGSSDSLTGAKLTFQLDSLPSSSGSYGTSSNPPSSSSSNTSSNSNGYVRPELSTSPTKAIGDGTLVQVVAEQAWTFPVNKNSIYPDTDCYPLPYGTMDYVTGEMVSIKDGSKYRYYYKLASGRRVYCEDVEAVTSGVSIRNNRITNMTVRATDDFTYVILQSDNPVSFLPSYSTGRIRFEFQNTSSTPGDLSLSQNPLFSSATWNGSTLTLELLDNNGFLGYKAYHENGNIVLRFNNPTGIEGARITVDPGHGGSDPGVADNIDPDWPEKRINWELAQAIADALEEKGAEVNLLNTYNNTTTMQSRLAQAKNFDSSLFLCIHTNSSEVNTSASGSECYYFYPFAKKLAAQMSSATSDGLSTSDRGAKYDVFYVTRDPQMVGILSEVGFLTNSTEYGKMQQDSYQEGVGEAVADAIEEYLEAAGSEYAGRTGTQSTGTALTASDGPTFNEDAEDSTGYNIIGDHTYGSSGSSGSSTSSNNDDEDDEDEDNTSSSSGSSSSSSRPSGPVSETVIAEGPGTGDVQYIIFTDPENKKLNMEVGDEKQLGIKLTGDSTVTRKYTTSDKYVATIDEDGVVHAVGAGSCKITVVAGDQGGTIDVRVTGDSYSASNDSGSGNSRGSNSSNSGRVEDVTGKTVDTTGITIKASRSAVHAGESMQLQVIFSPSNATGEDIEWSITRGSLYGEVDNRGVFTGIESGFSTVKAETADGEHSATLRIEII